MFTQAHKRSESTPHKTAQAMRATPALASPMPSVVQRKPPCTCGGTCPKCRSKLFQAKLSVSEPGDPLEREADHVADSVMRMPHPEGANHAPASTQALSIQRASALVGKSAQLAMWSTDRSDPLEPEWFDDERGTKSYVARRAAGTDTQTDPSGAAIEAEIGKLPQDGSGLSREELHFFEPRFGSDFGAVRIHADAHADHLARAINAEAFTVGSHIAFRSDRYAPHTESGRRLLAHELTHVVQQSGSDRIHVGQGGEKRGLSPIAASEVRVQRGPSDPGSPKVDVPIFGGSSSTSKVVVLYHYGNLEARRETDEKTETGTPFKSSPGYPRLTDCETATCSVEVTRHTGTPQNEKLRFKYELRIDRAYFEKNFSNTGTRGAYSEFVSRQSIPIKYFRIVSEIAPTGSAPPRLPDRSGELTAKPPRPTPPTQRGKVVTQGGSYQEVLSGETVTSETGGKGVPPKLPGGGGTGPAVTTKVTAEIGAPLEPVVEATPGFNPGTGAAIGGGVQMLQAMQFGSLQHAEIAKYEKRLAELQPKIDAFLSSGYSVELILIVEKPNSPDVLCAAGAFCDQGQFIYFHDLYIKSVESVKPVTRPSPRDTTHASMSAGRAHFVPERSQGGPMFDIINDKEIDKAIRNLPTRDPIHHCEYATLTLSPRESISPIEPRRPPAQPVKPKPLLSFAAKRALAAAPARVYVMSENIVQYRTAAEVMKKLAGNPLFGEVKEYMGGGLGRTRTIVSYPSDLDKPKAEALAEIVLAAGVSAVRAEINGSGDGDPGVLTIWFGRDAEK